MVEGRHHAWDNQAVAIGAPSASGINQVHGSTSRQIHTETRSRSLVQTFSLFLPESATRRLPLVAMLQCLEDLRTGQPCIASWQLCNHYLFEGATERKR